MYCWDDAKNESNREKHGIGFAAAPLVFEGVVVEVQDPRTTFEIRINAFGLINGRMFVCTYTPRCGWRHIISLRKANKREVKRYG